MGDVDLQLATRGPASVATGGPAQLVVALGPDEIVLDEVALVLRKVRLDGAPTASGPEDAEGDSQCARCRIKFQIHRPTDANEDADFVADHPELEDVEDVVFAEPVEVAVDGAVQVTLHVDVAGWFASEDGAGLVNPSEANGGGPFESLVERQIRESFRAFHDGDLAGAAD